MIPSIQRLPAALLDLLHATLANPRHFANLASPDIPLDVGAMRVLPKKPTALAFVVGRDGKPQNVALLQSFAFPQIVEAGRDRIKQYRLEGLEKFSRRPSDTPTRWLGSRIPGSDLLHLRARRDSPA